MATLSDNVSVNIKNTVTLDRASPVIFVIRRSDTRSFTNICVKDTVKFSFTTDTNKYNTCTATIRSLTLNQPLILSNVWCVRFQSIFYNVEYPYHGTRTISISDSRVNLSAYHREKSNSPPIRKQFTSIRKVEISGDNEFSNTCKFHYWSGKSYELKRVLSLDMFTHQMFENKYYDVTLFPIADVKFLGKKSAVRTSKHEETLRNIDYMYFGKSDPLTSCLNKTQFHVKDTDVESNLIWYTSGNFTLI